MGSLESNKSFGKNTTSWRTVQAEHWNKRPWLRGIATESEGYSLEEAELEAAIEAVLTSSSPKRLVIAGPGTGKTTLFKLLLESLPTGKDERIVLTFINNLKDDLEKDLGTMAQVYTLHSYCLSLLHRHATLREPLTENFTCCPGLASLISDDYKIIKGDEAPHFVGNMRTLKNDVDTQFYLDRGIYYNAVDFDDTVYRVHQGFANGKATVDSFQLVLVDEYQDFNALEAGFIDVLAETNPIVIAGDDDQALYSQLRNASWEHIRLLNNAGDYEIHKLPFCMRCPKVIVDAVNDIITKANALERLDGRIDKPYKHFPPVKGFDSAKYPLIDEVKVSVQRQSANYMGQYIAQAICKIPENEILESLERRYPTALVIVAQPYRKQIVQYLVEAGYDIDTKRDSEDRLTRDLGLAILKSDSRSNIGWRIILSNDKPKFFYDAVRTTNDNLSSLVDSIPDNYRTDIISQVEEYETPKQPESITEETSEIRATIKVTSFEGAKGLSAQHVYMVGLHNGEIPHDPRSIKDLEICKFIVGLTRTRKKCSLIHTNNFAGTWKTMSCFLGWIDSAHLAHIDVNSTYWKQVDSEGHTD